jgi:SecD/SecF fusion protein
MKRDALVAVIVATICMLIYIWIRFRNINFAVAAVVALIHDVLIVVALYAIDSAGITVGNTFIACLLTIVGYSINATIVIFDRIRENIAENHNRFTYGEIVNKSITQTFSRSINTSLTTFIAVLFLAIMGATSVKEFAIPLIVGIIAGTFSSVCLTGGLWYTLQRKFKKEV